MKKKIITVIGARPQFVKAAPVSKVLREYFHELIIHTGQHYDYKMSGLFFDELDIPKPDYNLGIGSQTHGAQTGAMITELEKVFLLERPDAVLVYGDTNSTLAAAIVSSKLHIPLIHVEAGLRSFNKKMPEEVNRILTDHVSAFLFAPTDTAVENLKREGIFRQVHQIGDVMYDAFLANMEIANHQFDISKFSVQSENFSLATIHRAENTDDPERLAAIVEGLLELGTEVIFPIHPRTGKYLQQYGLETRLRSAAHIRCVEPLSYLEMVFLENHARTIITDSGGVQKEAYFAKVPCITLRDQTEWVETVESGWNQLVNPLDHNLRMIAERSRAGNEEIQLYGDGKASEKIVQILKEQL